MKDLKDLKPTQKPKIFYLNIEERLKVIQNTVTVLKEAIILKRYLATLEKRKPQTDYLN